MSTASNITVAQLYVEKAANLFTVERSIEHGSQSRVTASY